jgi:hypothetical protein
MRRFGTKGTQDVPKAYSSELVPEILTEESMRTAESKPHSPAARWSAFLRPEGAASAAPMASQPARSCARHRHVPMPILRRPVAASRARLVGAGAFGLETLDLPGIDIDQDPHAFAKLLELTNPAQQGE